jgi:hypothetical protein
MDFFDKMKDNISKGIDTIGAKGKELVEETQLQLQLSSLREKRQKSLEELGALAYAQFQKAPPTDEAAKRVCDAIAALDLQIAAKQAELKHEAVPAAPSAAGTALVKCECGAEYAHGVKFCASCGNKLG